MTDLQKQKLRGPVRTLTTEHAEWDLAQQAWRPPRSRSSFTFRPDGNISETRSYNPDGSVPVSTYIYDDKSRLIESRSRVDDDPITWRVVSVYDEAGHLIRTTEVAPDGTERESARYSYEGARVKTKISFVGVRGLPDTAYATYGTESGYLIAGAATTTTVYDEGAHVSEVVFYNADRRPRQRLIYTRDSEGRVLREEMRLDRDNPFTELGDKFDGAPPEERARVLAIFAAVFPDETFSRTTYAYDRRGLLIERNRQMGVLSEERTTFRYDDHDNPIEEITEHHGRQVNSDDDGRIIEETDDTQPNQFVRFEYRYDQQGNWTERIVSSRSSLSSEFQISNVERRQITYYGV